MAVAALCTACTSEPSVPDGVIRGSVLTFGHISGWQRLGAGPFGHKYDGDITVKIWRGGSLQTAQHLDRQGYVRVPVPPGTYRVSVEDRIPNEAITGPKYESCPATQTVPVRSGYLTTVLLACPAFVPTGARLRRLYPAFQRHGNNRKPPPPVLTRLPRR